MSILAQRVGTASILLALLDGCTSAAPMHRGADDQARASSHEMNGAYPAAPTTPTDIVPFGDGVTPTTFVDSDDGFQIDVPAGWFISESGGHDLIMMSYDPTRLPPTQMGFGPDMTKIVVDVEDDVSRLDESLDDVVERKLSVPGMYVRSDLSIVRREAWELIDGMQAIRYDLEDPHAVTAHLVTRIGDRVVSVGGHGDLSPFDAVARTLRALGGDDQP